ncbi:MAG: putative holin-like toxin [Brochothrix thermosphacta]
MRIGIQSKKGNAFLTVFESLQLMFGFGIFIISLLTLVVVLIKLDKKK